MFFLFYIIFLRNDNVYKGDLYDGDDSIGLPPGIYRVISEKVDEIYTIIRDLTHHDGTLFKGVGMYQGKTAQELLLTL